MLALQLLFISAVLVGSYGVLGECEDREFDALFFRYEGQTWKRRCDTCVCEKGKITCNGGPKCTIPYNEAHGMTCLQWTADKCCCLKEGCKGPVDHREYKFDQWVPQDSKGCHLCKCVSYGRGECRMEDTARCNGGNFRPKPAGIAYE